MITKKNELNKFFSNKCNILQKKKTTYVKKQKNN